MEVAYVDRDPLTQYPPTPQEMKAPRGTSNCAEGQHSEATKNVHAPTQTGSSVLLLSVV